MFLAQYTCIKDLSLRVVRMSLSVCLSPFVSLHLSVFFLSACCVCPHKCIRDAVCTDWLPWLQKQQCRRDVIVTHSTPRPMGGSPFS